MQTVEIELLNAPPGTLVPLILRKNASITFPDRIETQFLAQCLEIQIQDPSCPDILDTLEQLLDIQTSNADHITNPQIPDDNDIQIVPPPPKLEIEVVEIED